MNSSVGKILREAREHQGRAIAEVAEELCLTPRYVLAIEQDDVQCLPGLFFYRSFVRQYAKSLAVDLSALEPGLQAAGAVEPSSSVAAVSKAEALVVDPAVESTNRRYFSDRKMAAPMALLVAVVLGCTGVYALWNRTISDRAIAAVKSVAQSVTPAKTQTVIAAAPANVQVTAATTVAGDSNIKTVSLNLEATDETWVSITSGGKEIFSGTLQRSQSKTVEGVDIATMRIGNAGGVDVRLNGKQIPPLGKRGDVLTVRFTPQDFKIVPQENEPL